MQKRAFYEDKARNYEAPDALERLRYELALGMSPVPEGTRVLDLGCKHGCLLDWIEVHGIRCHYVGLDISSTLIDRLEQRTAPAAVVAEFTAHDVTKPLPYPDASFDRVFCLEILEHVENPTFCVQEIRRVLRGAKACGVISTPNPYYYLTIIANLLGRPDREGHIASFTRQTMRNLLEFCGMHLVAVRGTYAVVPFGVRAMQAKRYWHFKSNALFLTRSYLYQVTKSETP